MKVFALDVGMNVTRHLTAKAVEESEGEKVPASNDAPGTGFWVGARRTEPTAPACCLKNEDPVPEYYDRQPRGRIAAVRTVGHIKTTGKKS